MDEFEEYIISLPRVETEEERAQLISEGKPFVAADYITQKHHLVCSGLCNTRVIEVYVPGYGKIPFHRQHALAENPEEECRSMLEEIAGKEGRAVEDTLICCDVRAFSNLFQNYSAWWYDPLL